MNDELVKKIDSLDEEELVAYNNAARAANAVVSLLGLGTILFVLNLPNIITIALGILFVMTFSHLSVALCNTRKYILERLKKFQR